MPKGIQRNNREPKKPKKERPKTIEAPSTLRSLLEKTQSKIDHAKKS